MKTYTWDKYVKEADVEPFVLEVRDDYKIVIENPTGVQVMRISEGMRAGDVAAILLGITGDAYQEVLALLGKAGHGALTDLTEDLLEHFHFYEEVTLRGPGGGTVKVTRPREVQALLKQGYVVAGEALPSL